MRWPLRALAAHWTIDETCAQQSECVVTSVQFFGNYQVSPSVANNFALESFIGIITQVTMWTGLIFEMPLIVLDMKVQGEVERAIRGEKVGTLIEA